ncbi:hypothetical protein M6D81_27595 [Paenibacillus sp. J5C_2022]|uniref:hypothetical protein n=1 Tax=Paenibacillus sp. J5C2022 TaxID=2977129 RepID=UPI0021D1B3E7|nr:hypothetical protein [Paenibacillus sp. J5C2022]MCU6712466.1 hypothetical protein [Paenibacillus sp. J5C2022]
MNEAYEGEGASQDRKPYYVSVQAGQILEDQAAAVYELDILATDEEVATLRELFEELSTMDEASMFHFSRTFTETDSDQSMNSACDDILNEIYRKLHECGTEETKRHIDSMRMLGG